MLQRFLQRVLEKLLSSGNPPVADLSKELSASRAPKVASRVANEAAKETANEAAQGAANEAAKRFANEVANEVARGMPADAPAPALPDRAHASPAWIRAYPFALIPFSMMMYFFQGGGFKAVRFAVNRGYQDPTVMGMWNMLELLVPMLLGPALLTGVAVGYAVMLIANSRTSPAPGLAGASATRQPWSFYVPFGVTSVVVLVGACAFCIMVAWH